MAQYATLKAAIDAVIKANGQREITGTVLNQTLNAMVNSLGANYQFAGVATPSTNPGTPDQNVCYLAGQGGTYTNFNNIAIPNGISFLLWNGSWSSQTVLSGDGGVFDISAYKATGGTLATFAELSAALGENGANVPIKFGGMQVRFVSSSDNKYVQARCMAQNFTTDVTQWQGVDDEPIADSNNLVNSNGIYNVKRDALFKPVSGLAYEIIPNTEETDTIYYADGTTATLSGYTAKKYQLAKDTVVKITISKNYVDSTYAIIAYKDSSNNFYPILRGPIMYHDNNDMYLTITPMMNELIVVGGDLVGIDTHYENYTDAFFKDKKVGYFVKNNNTEAELAAYTLYYFDVTNIEKAYLYVASGGNSAYCLFVDNSNNIVGTPFKTGYNSIWKELSIPQGAVTLKVSSVNPSNDYPNAKACKLLLYQSNVDSIRDNEKALEEKVDSIQDFIDIVYDVRKDGCYVNNQNVEAQLETYYLYYFNVKNSTKVKVFVATKSAYCLFVDDSNTIVGTPFRNNSFDSMWIDVDVPVGAEILKVSAIKQDNAYPNLYPCRVIADKKNYDILRENAIKKTMVNVGMSIWHYDETAFGSRNTIDGEGTICKGYQTLLKQVFTFDKVVKYAYSGYSLGVGDDSSASIMSTKASTWAAQENAIWTLDTITNDFQRDVPLGVPSDFDNATGINTFYGALRAFKDRVAELTTNPIIVCANAVYRTFGDTENGLGLTLEDYEKAMCYAAAHSGWYFVDQYRNSVNAMNADMALYDGLHLSNFGYRLAVKPWVEQFYIIQKLLLK